MIVKDMFYRESGLKEILKSRICNSVFSKFVCRQHDEYLVHPSTQSCPALACSFSKIDLDFLAVVDEEGRMNILDTRQTGSKTSVKNWQAHENAIFDVDWMPGERQLLTSSGDKTVVLWNVLEEEKLETFHGHKSSVKTAKFQPDNKAIFVSGSRDGHIKMWDIRTSKKEVLDIVDAHRCPSTKRKSVTDQKSAGGVTGVLFLSDHSVISIGEKDGIAKEWDWRKISYKNSLPVPKHEYCCHSGGRPHGLSSLALDSRCSRLFVSSMDNIIFQFDCLNCRKSPVATFSGHDQKSFYVKSTVSPDDSCLLSGSSDRNAYIWSIDNPKTAPLVLNGQTEEVSAVAWCPNDLSRVVTINDGGTFWIWRVSDFSDRQIADDASLRAIGAVKKDSVLSTGLRTPKKAKALPQIPALKSPITQRPIPPFSASKLKASSPSILNFFGKSPSVAIADRPMFTKSPRKLIISPSKSPKKQEAVGNDCTRISGVKRKLCIDDDSCLENIEKLRLSKVPKNDIEKSSLLFQSASPSKCRRKLDINVLSPSKIDYNMMRSTSSRAKLEDASKYSIEKKSDDSINCRYLSEIYRPSLTVNLPNYSNIGLPCRPVISDKNIKKGKSIDWLTQLRINQQKKCSSSPKNGSSGISCKTPSKRSSSNKKASGLSKSTKKKNK